MNEQELENELEELLEKELTPKEQELLLMLKKIKKLNENKQAKQILRGNFRKDRSL